jgi:chorismate-pyruvate lyase
MSTKEPRVPDRVTQDLDFDLDRLELLQRILVVTDGTVTDVLAAAFRESIALVRIDIATTRLEAPVASLELDAGASMMRRRVVLRGATSGRRFACAETRIATDRLAPALQRDLLEGQIPLGQLWIAHRLETWKERPRVTFCPAGERAVHLDVDREAPLIRREYRSFTGGVPVFHVTEFFPLRYDAG